MTTPGVHNCDECQHFAWRDFDRVPKLPTFDKVATCAMGHRPTFILPDESHYTKPWGYRRKCGDFKQNITGHLRPDSGRDVK